MGMLLYFLSGIIGCQAGYIISVLLPVSSETYSMLITVLIVVFSGISGIVICRIVQYNSYNYAKKLMRKDRNALQFIAYADKTMSRSVDIVLKVKMSLLLCDYYKNLKEYQSAVKALDISTKRKTSYKVINNICISKRIRFLYYLELVNVNTLANNIIDAQSAFEKGNKLFTEFCEFKKYRFDILKTLALYEYAKGDYTVSERLIKEAKEATNNIKIMDELSLLLSRIYYSTERYELFEGLLEEIIQNKSSKETVEKATQLLLKKA